ncbi:hypothetical protein BASA50_008960 [Batrachochytrium salamandrivorans]|uniref:DAGKc domain-containing protein n=1 Tax=Batrachochytrium salamandrivorans TaxID=1357716 RepID=A0ABQ8F2F1_9FUNG|nr:hypothetical protein BASA62_007374 [Batrachochytrium salamandrivorans]KAH6572184.1 hypothetical protein BASA60_006744 [Batrachochytrium salamandrivorans]KAH6590960.1 hypothetical protein BASA50_008960 [Batrachochytrium salamandrivorans]KAH6601879.1 hypothetical protein BASA61_001679 [Batrachochytrium salamandrivorans]KAH9268560.1 hypothetical protein BASA84_000165 [Batrachochytrium salamandrivorans]
MLGIHIQVVDSLYPLAPSQQKVALTVTETHLKWTDGQTETTLALESIVGASHIMPITKTSTSKPFSLGVYCGKFFNRLAYTNIASMISPAPTGYWQINALDLSKNEAGDMLKPVLRTIQFEAADASSATGTVNTLLDKMYPDRQEKKILFILNPYGGTKKAKKLFTTTVLPFMKMAGYGDHHQLIETQHPGHAITIANDLDVKNYKCAVTISGDGILHEFISGLFSRSDWNTARQLPVGTIGAGSANAMCKNMDMNFPELGIITTLKGHTKPTDIFSFTQDNVRMFSHLLVMFAFVADVDIGSEKYRYMGEIRLTLAALVRLVKIRNYKAKLYVLTSENGEKYKVDQTKQPMVAGLPTIYTSLGSTSYRDWPLQVDAYFQLFIASNFPWVSSEFLIAPLSKIDDGEMTVVWSENMGSMRVLKTLLNQESGESLTYDAVKHTKALAFAIEPDAYTYQIPSSSVPEPSSSNAKNPSQKSRLGIMDVSGEKVSYSPIVVEVHTKMLNLVVPPWLDMGRWEKPFMEKYGSKLKPL